MVGLVGGKILEGTDFAGCANKGKTIHCQFQSFDGESYLGTGLTHAASDVNDVTTGLLEGQAHLREQVAVSSAVGSPGIETTEIRGVCRFRCEQKIVGRPVQRRVPAAWWRQTGQRPGWQRPLR